MGYRYELEEAAANDFFKATKRNHALALALLGTHLPRLLKDPLGEGAPKKGNLSGLRAYNISLRGSAYRLVYRVEGDVVFIVAFGLHDEAYRKASRR